MKDLLPRPAVTNVVSKDKYYAKLYTEGQMKKYAQKMVELERETCRKLCDDIWQDDGSAYDCREAIKARGETK